MKVMRGWGFRVVEDELGGRFQEWVVPSPGERAAARAILLDVFSTGSVLTLQMLTDVALDAGGLTIEAVNGQVDVNRNEDGSYDFDGDAAPLRGQRVMTAMFEALSDLLAAGTVQRVVQNGSNPDARVGVQMPGLGTSCPVHLFRPHPNGDGFRLHRRILDDPALIATDPDELTAGLDSLLGSRGIRCLAESVACYRAGEFLAAAMMLGAANEAAWYRLASLLVEASPGRQQLSDAIDGNYTAKVVNGSCDALNDLAPKRKREVAQLRAQAELMLNVRNYGLHPRDDADLALEDHFTELGCTALLMSNRLFLTRLRDLAVRAGLLSDRGGS